MFSDLFRYSFLRRSGGTCVDCDVYVLRPIPDSEYIFAWEGLKFLNVAVLKLPVDSPLLDDLWTAANNPVFIPPWLSKKKRRKLKLRRLLGLHRSSHLPRDIRPSRIDMVSQEQRSSRIGALTRDILSSASG